MRAGSEGETVKSGFARMDLDVPTEYLTDVPPERDGPPPLKVRELQMATALAGREELDNDAGREWGTPLFRKQVREEEIQGATKKQESDRQDESDATRVGKSFWKESVLA